MEKVLSTVFSVVALAIGRKEVKSNINYLRLQSLVSGMAELVRRYQVSKALKNTPYRFESCYHYSTVHFSNLGSVDTK